MKIFSSIDKLKVSFTNTSFIAALLVLLVILFIRVTRGIDLTDEMQYYGEIKGMIETGQLFSNDLFIQQSVYILFYPAFYIYHALFDFEGLIFFGRLLMAVLSIGVFLYAYRKFIQLKFSVFIASLTALSLTFGIPYHGIFAPSYNTLSQMLWIIFIIRFFEWKQHSIISWAVISVITAFAHPTSAIMMSVLVFLRLLQEQNYKQVAKLMLALLGGGLIVLPMVLYFAAPQDYLDSLTFSSGYGVGTVFFSGIKGPITLLSVYLMFGIGLLSWTSAQSINFSLLLCLTIAVAIVLLASGLAGGAYTYRTVYILASLSALAYVWVINNFKNCDSRARYQNHWLVLTLLVFATTLGITSGNGIGQATGAFMIGLPLLLAVAVNSDNNKGKMSNYLSKNIIVILVPILLAANWNSYPYRESSWWQASQVIRAVPEFKLLYTSPSRIGFIQKMKHELEPMIQGKRTLIVSEYPGLYLALGAIPETCMLYMHSLTSDKSENALMGCLSEKKPEIVIDVLANRDRAREGSRIKRVLHSYYSRHGFNCINETMKFDPDDNNPQQLTYTVCK